MVYWRDRQMKVETRSDGSGSAITRREIPPLRGHCSLCEQGKRLATPVGMTGLGGWFRIAQIDEEAELFTAELFDPAEKNLVGRCFHIQELDAHSDARLNDAHDRESVHDLIFAGHPQADAATLVKGLAGADESAADGKIAGDAAGFRAGFQV
jgi:hypothetical protein